MCVTWLRRHRCHRLRDWNALCQRNELRRVHYLSISATRFENMAPDIFPLSQIVLCTNYTVGIRRYTYEFIKQDLMDIPQPGFSFGLCSRVIVPLHAILFSIVLYLYRNYVFFIRFSEGRQVHYGWPSRSGVHGQRLIRIKSLVCQAPTEIYTTGSNHPER